jgi:hypothetical protein
VATPVERRSFDHWTKNNNNNYYYYIKKNNDDNLKKKKTKQNKTKQNKFWTVLPKPSRIASRQFGQNHMEFLTVWPKTSITRISDTFSWTKPSRPFSRLFFAISGWFQIVQNS